MFQIFFSPVWHFVEMQLAVFLILQMVVVPWLALCRNCVGGSAPCVSENVESADILDCCFGQFVEWMVQYICCSCFTFCRAHVVASKSTSVIFRDENNTVGLRKGGWCSDSVVGTRPKKTIL